MSSYLQYNATQKHFEYFMELIELAFDDGVKTSGQMQ